MRVFLFCLLIIISQPFFGLSEGLEPGGSVNLIVNTDSNSAPSPVLPSVNFSYIMAISDNLYLNAGIGIYGWMYFYDGSKALPGEIEMAGTTWTLFTDLNVNLEMGGTLDENFALYGFAGLSLLFRLPIIGDDPVQNGNLWTYFMTTRFIYPQGGIKLSFIRNENTAVNAYLGVKLPVYNIWMGDFILDQTVIFLKIGFLF